MKVILRVISIVVIVVFSLAFLPAVGLAAGQIVQVETPPTVLDVILKIALGFASLAGVSRLNTVIVQILKLIKVAQDNTAAKWAAGLNLVAFCVLIYFGVFQPQIAIEILDGYAAQIAEIALFVLGFFIQMTGSKAGYEELRGARVPLLSYSHTEEMFHNMKPANTPD